MAMAEAERARSELSTAKAREEKMANDMARLAIELEESRQVSSKQLIRMNSGGSADAEDANSPRSELDGNLGSPTAPDNDSLDLRIDDESHSDHVIRESEAHVYAKRLDKKRWSFEAVRELEVEDVAAVVHAAELAPAHAPILRNASRPGSVVRAGGPWTRGLEARTMASQVAGAPPSGALRLRRRLTGPAPPRRLSRLRRRASWTRTRRPRR